MKFHFHREPLSHRESGQCLTEMLMVFPLFLILLAGIIAYMTALGWRDTLKESGSIARLALLEESTDRLPWGTSSSGSDKIQRLFGRIQQASQPATVQQERQPPRQSLLRYQGQCQTTRGAGAGRTASKNLLPGRGLASAPQTEAPLSTLTLCGGRHALTASPTSDQLLTQDSQSLRELIDQRPQLHTRTSPVFDAWEPFSATKRRDWSRRIARQVRFRSDQRHFIARVASGGDEQQSPRFNITRDCVFSSQGKVCQGDASRKSSAVHDLFAWQRKKSQTVQIAACTAEACARAPVPPVCALTLAANLAYLAAQSAEPKTCPIAAQAAKTLHESGRLILKGAQMAEQWESLQRGLRVDTVGSMY